MQMRGRPMGRSDNASRRKPGGDTGGRMGENDRRRGGVPFRNNRGGGEFREPRRDGGRRLNNREEFRQPVEGPYDRDARRPPIENQGPYRDNRRPAPLMEPPRIDRRPPQDDFRSMRDNFRDDFPPRGFADARMLPRSADMHIKNRGDAGGKPPPYGRDPPSVMSRLSPKKRPLEKRPAPGSPLRDDDLRKRLRGNFRSKSPITSGGRDFDSPNTRKDRPEFRGPEENVQFNRADLRKLQIRITKPETGLPARRFEPPSRRPVSPEPMYPPREGDRGRPRQDSFGKGPYRDQHQAWDNDIALHRMKNDGVRHNMDSDTRKPFRRDEMHRVAMPDRRGPPEAGRGRGPPGGERGRGRDRHDRPMLIDRGRYDSHPIQEREPDRRDRERMPQREVPRYADVPPRRGRSAERSRNTPGYPQFGREGPQPPMFDYPPRRPVHGAVY